MTDKQLDPGDTVSFGARFTGSELFQQVFREGMALVEETAAYLDGEGRKESRCLGKQTALAYATESMRLTTRLMQVASWLLIQRAVAEGEMAAEDAYAETSRVPLKPPVAKRERPLMDELPERLRELMARTDRIYTRLYRLDLMLGPNAAPETATNNPVVDQLGRLEAAFKTD